MRNAALAIGAFPRRGGYGESLAALVRLRHWRRAMKMRLEANRRAARQAVGRAANSSEDQVLDARLELDLLLRALGTARLRVDAIEADQQGWRMLLRPLVRRAARRSAFTAQGNFRNV